MAAVAPDFLVLPENVRRNPVTRAIARDRLRKFLQLYLTRLHMLDDGEEVPDDCRGILRWLGMAWMILCLQQHEDTPAGRVIRGGIGAVVDVSKVRWIWRRRHLVAVVQAMVHAGDVLEQAAPDLAQEAYARVNEIELQVLAEQLAQREVPAHG